MSSGIQFLQVTLSPHDYSAAVCASPSWCQDGIPAVPPAHSHHEAVTDCQALGLASGHLQGRTALSVLSHWNIRQSTPGSSVQARVARKATRLNPCLVAWAVLVPREFLLFYLWQSRFDASYPFVRGENPVLEGKGVTQSSRVCTVKSSSVEKSQAQCKCVLILKVSSAH